MGALVASAAGATARRLHYSTAVAVALLLAAPAVVPLPPRRTGSSPCPPHSEPEFPAVRTDTRYCDVITFAGGVAPGAMATGTNTWWREGLQLFADHVNAQGGLRLGQGGIGFVNISLTLVEQDDTETYTTLYRSLCDDPGVNFLLAPLQSNSAVVIHGRVGCEKKLYLAADAFDKLSTFDNLFSVYGVREDQWGMDPISLLYGLGARTFEIAGKKDNPDLQTARALKDAIFNHTRLDTSCHFEDADLVAVGQDPKLLERVDAIIEREPDVFIGLGDSDTLTTLLKYFKKKRYAPKAAFFIQGLAATEELLRDSYTQESCDDCVVYDQWMGTMPWTREMPFYGRKDWTGLADPYGDGNATNTSKPECNNLDCRWARYMGDAETFATLAGGSKSLEGHQVNYYHAKAAAVLLMVQLGVELAPDARGYGMTASEITDVSAMKQALYKVNQDTWFGKMEITQHTEDGGGGWNKGFKLGFAQFQKDANAPVLIDAPSVRDWHVSNQPVYPAEWPCELTDWWCPKWWQIMLLVGGGLAVLAGIVLLCGKRTAKSRSEEQAGGWGMLRESLLGTSFAAPQEELAEQDVEGRWQNAAQTAQAQEGGLSRPASPDGERSGRSGGGSGGSSGGHRRRRGDDSKIHIMFADTHVRELQPADGWKQQVLGKGSYGVVYRATWRGQQVAVKELRLPEEPEHIDDGRAREAFKKRLRAATETFVQEVTVCCDLAHPNLVRMLGYSARPAGRGEGLLLVQEYLAGKALDAQLYDEQWKPTALQVLKAAIDIARGMEYLHTAFEGDYGRNPIIHRCGKRHLFFEFSLMFVPSLSWQNDHFYI